MNIRSFLLNSFVILASLLGPVTSSAQTTITTYYVIPPTSGCNGVWAIDYPTFLGCSAVTYMWNPINCGTMTGATFNGDTMYIPLCAVPCALTMIDMNGNTCICSTGTPTSIEPKELLKTRVSLFPNILTNAHELTVALDANYKLLSFRIYNGAGQTVFAQELSAPNQSVVLKPGELATGNYVLIVSDNSTWTELLKFVSTK